MVTIGGIIIGFEVGLIIDILIEESLKNAFKFSLFFGATLAISFLIYKIADYFSLIETIEDGLENFWEWIKELFGD